jgi:outer membrane protein TolC
MLSKIPLFLSVLVFALNLSAQSIGLDEVVSASRNNYPLLKMNVLNEQLVDLRLKTVNASWLPTFTLNAQGTYQSDITSLPINIPGVEIPDLYKDQYKASLDITQVIYDGGYSSARKDLEYTDLQVQKEEINKSLKEIEILSADIFFSVLSLEKSKEQLELMLSDLDKQISIIESGVKNGVVLQSTLDQLLVEKLSLNQKISELYGLIEANIQLLQQLTKLPLNASTEFTMPENFKVQENFMLETPELRLFELNDTKLAGSMDLMKVRKMPKVGAFAQFGYGRPGLNMFTNSFDSYYFVGVKATWSLWSGGKNNTEIDVIQVQRQMLEVQKESYMLNMELSRTRLWQNIENLQTQLQTDEEIFQLRESILKSYDSQFQNGVITADEYLRHLNNKTMAAVALEMHKIQLTKAQYNYLRTFGK